MFPDRHLRNGSRYRWFWIEIVCVPGQGQKHIFHCSCLKPKGPHVFSHQPSSTSTNRVPSTALNLLMQLKIQFPFVRRVGLSKSESGSPERAPAGFLTFRFPAHTNFLTLSCFHQLLSVETAPGGRCVDPRFTRAIRPAPCHATEKAGGDAFGCVP